MKKITLLILLLIMPLLGFSQTWVFTTDAEGWTGSGGTLSHTGTTNDPLVITFTDTQGNPKLLHASANIDAINNPICAITMKNNSVNTYLRVSHIQGDGTGRTYANKTISINDAEFVTYYFDMTNASNWGNDNGGIENDINIHIRANSTGGAPGNNVSNGNVEFDKIEFIASIPLEEKLDYLFDVDAEGWAENNSTLTVSGGVATIVPDVGTSAKITQNTNSVDADTNGYMHILYKNESLSNNQLRIQFRSDDDGYTNYKGKNVAMSSNMSGYEVISIDLTTKTEWNGFTQDFQIIIRDTNNGNNASPGNLLIERILFSGNTTAVLAVDRVNYKEDASITLYPNPVNDVLTINSPLKIESLEVFNLLGQKILFSNGSSKTLNTSGLAKGMYIIKVAQENNVISTKRFIKQ